MKILETTTNHDPLPPFPPCHALVIVPPLSPTETNPPLGPYILRAEAIKSGLTLEVADLSALHLRRFRRSEHKFHQSIVGDHDKDRSLTHTARDHYRDLFPIADGDILDLPCCADPLLGMHLSTDAVDRLTDAACLPGHPLRKMLEVDLLDRIEAVPVAFGLSIMGPAQVLASLVVARLLRERWPGVPIVAGGSHITLLHDSLNVLLPHTTIDLAFPGHCEQCFARLVRALASPNVDPKGIVQRCRVNAVPPTDPVHLCSPFPYEPAIDPRDLVLYPSERVTLPLQLTRGCKMRCAYCTYPLVELERPGAIDFPKAVAAIQNLIASTGVRRFSLKDSLFMPNNLNTLANEVLRSGLDIDWSATTYLLPALTRDRLTLIAEAGCRTLEFGLETIDSVGQQLFGKRICLPLAERIIRDAAEVGITVVVNQIFGWPGQSNQSAEDQLAWYAQLRAACPERIRASANMLEVNRKAPLETRADLGIRGVAPWAFSYAWDAPAWRPEFLDRVSALT